MEIGLTKATIEEDDIRSMQDAIHLRAISEGNISRSFEKQFRDFLGVKGAVATNSCTSALILALKTIGIEAGDEVILPSYTCLAVLNAVVQIGAIPCLTDNTYDVLSMNYNMTCASVKEKLSPKVRAIIVPHMFGVPAEIDKILEIGIPVVEDVTLSLGAWYKGKPVGAWGDISVCSFHASKMIACGEGGMLASKSDALYDRARFLNSWEGEQSSLRLKTDNFEPYQLRYNFRLSDVAAALGISQLQKLSDFVARRRELAKRYTSRLSKVRTLELPE
ncbi:DegT/DnrJ/EryC1/StrS family aminotransferase, partial [bacterium]|nr:DegT/DnrJ/EryC1/StrS family aminotransferase [bacterium]